MSKGDNRRPAKVPKEEFESNWEKTFGKKETLKEKWESTGLLDSSPRFLNDVEAIFMDGSQSTNTSPPMSWSEGLFKQMFLGTGSNEPKEVRTDGTNNPV